MLDLHLAQCGPAREQGQSPDTDTPGCSAQEGNSSVSWRTVEVKDASRSPRERRGGHGQPLDAAS